MECRHEYVLLPRAYVRLATHHSYYTRFQILPHKNRPYTHQRRQIFDVLKPGCNCYIRDWKIIFCCSGEHHRLDDVKEKAHTLRWAVQNTTQLGSESLRLSKIIFDILYDDELRRLSGRITRRPASARPSLSNKYILIVGYRQLRIINQPIFP